MTTRNTWKIQAGFGNLNRPQLHSMDKPLIATLPAIPATLKMTNTWNASLPAARLSESRPNHFSVRQVHGSISPSRTSKIHNDNVANATATATITYARSKQLSATESALAPTQGNAESW